MMFETPDLTEEEQHGMHMPDYLRCDACQAISFMIMIQLEKAMNRKPSGNGKLKESEVIETMEDACVGEKRFEDYGIKEVNGKMRLSGPGLPTSEAPGIMAGGGKWPGRLRQMCLNLVGEVGDDEIYQEYYRVRDRAELQKFLCYGPEGSTQGMCSVAKRTGVGREPLPRTHHYDDDMDTDEEDDEDEDEHEEF